MTLAELQRRFAARIRDAANDDDGFAVGTAAAPAAERVGVYVHAYRARAAEALGTDFPKLQAWLGAGRFAALVSDYLDAHPSRSWTLRELGASLSAFLRGRGRRTTDRAAHELAAFEWALCHAFDAADAAPIEPAALGAFAPDAWPELCFACHPSLRRFALATNAVAIWEALERGEAAPAARRQRTSREWLTWRQDLRPMYRTLDAAEAAALDAVIAGEDFSGMCVALAAHVPGAEVPARAVGLLQRWMAGGLLTGVSRGAAPAPRLSPRPAGE